MPENKRTETRPDETRPETGGDHPGVTGGPNPGRADDPSKRSAEPAPEGEVDRDADEGGDLLSHFVRRTDNGYAGVEDKSLLGEDIGDDELDEDGEPI